MVIFLNGQFVPEAQAHISVLDRGFLYGDGLFETLRVLNRRVFRLPAHLERLRRGAEFLQIRLPFSLAELGEFVAELITRNAVTEGLLRITVSRGVGPRGYSPRGADRPSVVMTMHPSPATQAQTLPQWRLVTASVRLPANQPLAGYKTCNKLPQILARAEADRAGTDEALLLNTDGYVVEGSASNLFWIQSGMLLTPPLASGILPGVTRATVFEISQSLGLKVSEACIRPEQLRQAEGVLLSLSSVGIAEGVSLDGQRLRCAPLAARVGVAYAELLRRETSAETAPSP